MSAENQETDVSLVEDASFQPLEPKFLPQSLKQSQPISDFDPKTIERRFCFILNKITQTNYETIENKLFKEIKDSITSKSSMELLIDIILTSAIKCGGMYADVLARLCLNLSNNDELMDRFDNKRKGFCVYLVHSSQKKYTNIKSRYQEIILSQPTRSAYTDAFEDWSESRHICRQDYIYLSQFFGELYNVGLLGIKIIVFGIMAECTYKKSTNKSVAIEDSLFELQFFGISKMFGMCSNKIAKDIKTKSKLKERVDAHVKRWQQIAKDEDSQRLRLMIGLMKEEWQNLIE